VGITDEAPYKITKTLTNRAECIPVTHEFCFNVAFITVKNTHIDTPAAIHSECAPYTPNLILTFRERLIVNLALKYVMKAQMVSTGIALLFI
jgi:hypothetical protein